MDPKQKRRWLFVLAYFMIGIGLLSLVVTIVGYIFEVGKLQQLGTAIFPLIIGAVLLANLKRGQK